MTTPLPAAQLERLRRDAKRRAREKSIPLREAQQELATERGYRNWSLLVKASKAFQSIGQNVNRRAFATLFIRRYEEPLLAAIAIQLGHSSENAMEAYWDVARRPGAKGISERNAAHSAEVAGPASELHELAPQSAAGWPDRMSSTASVLDDVARRLGHTTLCTSTVYLKAQGHRKNRDT